MPDADDIPRPDMEVERMEMKTAVRQALARLPKRQTQLLLLRQMGLSYAECAEACDVAPGSVGTGGEQMTQSENQLDDVMEQLSLLEPTTAEAPRPAGQALADLKPRLRPRHNPIITFLRSLTMSQNRRLATTVATLVILFAIAFSFPGVRAAANEFLGLFRVQKFAAISISPDQIAVLEELANSGLTPGELVIVNEPGDARSVESLAEARVITGLEARTLARLGEPSAIQVIDGGDGRLIIDAAQAQEILKLAGADPRLIPDSLDGASVEVNVFASIEQEWLDGTFLIQTESPIVSYPEGLDPVPLGEALLQILGMNPTEAARLARSIDWTGTLLLPVPQDVATFSEVTIDGVSGLALTSLEGHGSALMWQKEGVVYILSGPGQTAELIELASSIE